MPLRPLNWLLVLFMLAAPLAAGCSGDDDDTSSPPGDDDATGDDDSPGDDDDATGDDDDATGDDDDATGDDDDATGDDDDSPATPTVAPDRDQDGDGYETPEDCDDTDDDVHPGATETCNGLDDDCDDQTDEGVQGTFYQDDDGDGYGDPEAPIQACEQPGDAVEDDTDCDDGDVDVNPGAEEVCNEQDDNCNDEIDEDVQETFYRDGDGDGYGDADSPILACDPDDGIVDDATDCDDEVETTHPGADELCDSVDNDCDDEIDEGAKPGWYTDGDKDGYGDPASEVLSCTQPTGTIARGGDCNDADASVNPGVPEQCNGTDDDCDSQTDEGVGDFYYPDADGDLYGDAKATPVQTCAPEDDYTLDHTDCNDADATVHPNGAEDAGAGTGFGDGKDNDCDGEVDEGTVDDSIYDIQQGDGYASGDAVSVQKVVAITGLTEPFATGSGQAVGFFVNEPAGGEYGGLFVQLPASLADAVDVEPGDELIVSGTFQDQSTNSSLVVAAAKDVVVLRSGQPVPAPEVIEQVCDVGGARAWEGLRVTVEDVAADELTANGFQTDECLNVSTALFFSNQEQPEFIETQPFHAVTGVLFGRAQLDLEVTGAEELDVAIFSHVDPQSGVYNVPVTVTFFSTLEDATIHYTLDGSTPTASSTAVTPGDSILIGPTTTTLKYFAKSPLETEAEVHTETYRFVRALGAHLLLSEVVVTPTEAEFIEIYNPTSLPIPLDDYYLTDNASHSGGSVTPYEYAKVVQGASSVNVGSDDFVVRFPRDSIIAPYEFLVVALNNNFAATYGYNPDFEVGVDGDDIPGMAPVKSGATPGLTNSHEMVMLFTWDGQSDLVTDVDYVLWGSKANAEEAVVKTGIGLDGPDAGTDPTGYKADTARAQQKVVASSAHSSGQSFCRADYTEGNEVAENGNGTSGHNETSEDFSATWRANCKAGPGL